MVRDIGFEVEAPRKECEDPHCPFHGSLPLRGRIFNGVVIKKKMNDAMDNKTESEKIERLKDQIRAFNELMGNLSEEFLINFSKLCY